MSEGKVDKDEAFWSILSAAIELDVKKGHLKWTMSDVARKSGITRSLIYYYFGRSKLDILKEAINIIGSEFGGVNEERMAMWRQGQLAESMLKTRRMYEKAPYLSTFFSDHLRSENEVGALLRDLIDRFIKKLKHFYPKATDDEIYALYSLFWGVSFAPFVPENSVRIISSVLKKYMTSNEH